MSDDPHYKKLKIEPVEYILANEIPFCEGNVIKYVTRWRDKGGLDDLRKAKVYIDKIIQDYETKNHGTPIPEHQESVLGTEVLYQRLPEREWPSPPSRKA